MPRMYEEVWIQLKKKDKVKLRIRPSKLSTTKAGIIKEKNRDIPFKIMNDNGENFRLRFSYVKEKHELYVELIQPLGIEEKVVV